MSDELTFVVIAALVVMPLVLLVYWIVRVMVVAWMVQSALLSLPFA